MRRERPRKPVLPLPVCEVVPPANRLVRRLSRIVSAYRGPIPVYAASPDLRVVRELNTARQCLIDRI